MGREELEVYIQFPRRSLWRIGRGRRAWRLDWNLVLTFRFLLGIREILAYYFVELTS